MVPVECIPTRRELTRCKSTRKPFAAAGDKYVNVLGASTAQQCLEAGVLDEIFVCIAPVLLGDGVRLFEDGLIEAPELERTSVISSPTGVTHLSYRVESSGRS